MSAKRLAFGIMVALALMAGYGWSGVVAQDATPTAGEEDSGVSYAFVGGATVDTLPATPADFVIVRISIEPGGHFSISPDDASLGLAVVESGSIVLNMSADSQLMRASSVTSEDFTNEPLLANTGTTLNAGDSFIGPANVAGSIRNDGTEPAVLLVALISPPEESAATPTA